MAASKKPFVKSGKPAVAPKPKAVPANANVALAQKVPVPPKAPQSVSGKAEESKAKKNKKKDKKVDGSNSLAGKKKMVRDSFTMPSPDYALIGVLKARTLASGAAVKKSELLRAGLVALAAMQPAQLIDLISAMPEVKTGRPGKKKK